MKFHLCFLFLLVGFSTAFIPTRLLTFFSGAWSSLNHKVITQAGLWCSVIEFLKTNPNYVNKIRADELASVNTARLLEGSVSSRLFRLVKSSKFQDAVKEIEYANAAVDKNEAKKSAAHFDAEQFREGSKRLIRLKKQVVSLIKMADYTKARKDAGTLLHTLQDFYSHSNWIESGNNDPLSILGDEIISESNIAGTNEKTCNDCTSASFAHLLGLGTDDCQNNLLNTGKLTSGYYDVAKPVGVGKCSHGGIFDKSRKFDAKGGINKDASLRYLSPHYRRHQPAARVAIKATKLFFDSIRRDVGDTKFATFLNMEALRTLSFAIDTSGSMSVESCDV
ncbi:Hypothetical predicted protein [Paramuricea clavata]|uniref:VWA7 N-terminal domain-containing protein n=1 Tax=Paramuricea clavata TaxID=317549 RepID=A0A6S7H170_PARCT|nr:Hypothetical predicted protein [Paramuricea clavata]